MMKFKVNFVGHGYLKVEKLTMFLYQLAIGDTHMI